MSKQEGFHGMYQSARKLNANAVTITNPYRGEETEDAVVEVRGLYINRRPPHDVLDDLERWAEENDRGDILDIIEEMEAWDYVAPWEVEE